MKPTETDQATPVHVTLNVVDALVDKLSKIAAADYGRQGAVIFNAAVTLAAESDRADRAEAELERIRQQLETTSYHPLKDPLFNTLRDAEVNE